MNRRRNYVWFVGVMVLTVGLVAALAWGLINREWIVDYVRGVSYQPTSEMSAIRDKLKLTDKGEFLFNATQPVLNGRETFNNICRTATDTEVAVLGCYTGGNIYIYNIVSDELKGIRELTTAHELLHAVWARMSDDERVALTEPLTRVFEANQDLLGKELDTYDIKEKQEELYVRAGTEVANLPDILEKHYGEVFSDQDLVVDFYNSYIKTFREIETEMDNLKAEMDTLSAEIDSLKVEFERAPTWALYYRINALVDEYNVRVEKYNADIERYESLNQTVNSSVKVEGV